MRVDEFIFIVVGCISIIVVSVFGSGTSNQAMNPAMNSSTINLDLRNSPLTSIPNPNANQSMNQQKNASNDTKVRIISNCCGWGHRLSFHADEYQKAMEKNLALVIHWPTFHEKCYSNNVGNNYTVHDLFDEIFDFPKIGVDTKVERGQIFQIDHLSEWQPHSWNDYQKLVDLNIVDGKRRLMQLAMGGNISSIKTGAIWDSKYIENENIKRFYVQIAENLKVAIKAQTDALLALDDDTNLMTIHVRQGNGEKGDFANKKRDNCESKTGKRWKIFVASDNEMIIDGLKSVSKYEIISREQQRAKQGAGVLHGQYGNDRPSGDCIGMAWDAWTDMLALSKGNILLIPAYSSFNYLPQIMVAENDGIVCGIFDHSWRCRTGNQMKISEDELNEKLKKL